MAKEKYDVVVVGSGAGGATAAYTLVNRGLNVILLEAGRMLNCSAARENRVSTTDSGR